MPTLHANEMSRASTSTTLPLRNPAPSRKIARRSTLEPLLPPIRDVLLRGLRPQAARGEIKELVNLCHKVAIAYLRPKAMMYRRIMNGLTPEEVSLDAIADLFEQRRGAGFPKLSHWLNRNSSIDQLTDDALWVEFRRIIFGAVNQHIYRLFHDADPALSRLIRNIKLALRTRPGLQLQESGGSTVIALRNRCDERKPLPELLPEFLEAECQARLSSPKTLKVTLDALESVLREETGYRDAVSLNAVALMVLTRTTAPPIAEHIGPPFEDITEEEILQMIDRTIHRLRPAAVKTYLETSKMNGALLESHLRALRDIFVSAIAPGEDGPSTFLHALQNHVPGMSEHQYQVRDKRILEYLAKQARRELKIMVMKDLGISARS